VEHEYDVILLGTFAGEPSPDPAEVAAWKWLDLAQLQELMRRQPEFYAPWFHIGLAKVMAAWERKKKEDQPGNGEPRTEN
jgi:isopentenyl-diphosphate delta-isomerase